MVEEERQKWFSDSNCYFFPEPPQTCPRLEYRWVEVDLFRSFNIKIQLQDQALFGQDNFLFSWTIGVRSYKRVGETDIVDESRIDIIMLGNNQIKILEREYWPTPAESFKLWAVTFYLNDLAFIMEALESIFRRNLKL